MNRREFMKFIGLSSILLYTGNLISSCGGGGGGGAPPEPVQQKNPLHLPSSEGLLGYFYPQDGVEFSINAEPAYFEILPGSQTRMLTYTVSAGGRTYYNPVIVLRRGQTFDVRFQNSTGEESIIHWHGFRADWQADGHPSYAVGSGSSYDYPAINIIDRSGTYFYHPHPHGRTGYQVYMGLGGMIIIEDAEEDSLRGTLDLELGSTDVPLILQDKTFNSDGSLSYNPMGRNGNMGFWGERILVNLTPDPYMDVSRRIYRFRLLNASNARPYRLVLLKGSQKMRFWIIGVEGGLLDRPRQVYELLIAPGERIDILVDFRDANLGDVLRFYSLQHNLVQTGRGRNADLINGEFEVLEFRVTQDSSYDRQIPSTISSIGGIDTSVATYVPLTLGMNNGAFNIDGSLWNSSDPLAIYFYTDSNGNTREFRFSNGEVVILEFSNSTGMYHPMHIHGFQFQVLSRSNSPQVIRDLSVDNEGRMATDLGWKDTVIVGPHETVRVAVDMSHSFSQEQIYLLHCHILEHHDAGMMVNYRVGA